MTGTTFTLHRSVDPSNVSGTGVVAEGWESSSGEYVVLVWLSETPSLCIYRDIRHVEEIHGHEGATQIVWDSPTQYTPSIPPPDEPEADNRLAPDSWVGDSKYQHDDPYDPRD